jgi:putative SOS response-associated peptidase YedK
MPLPARTSSSWRLWGGFRWTDGTVTRSFCIITTDANREVPELHDRMPMILEPTDWPAWLGETEGDPASLLHPAPDGTLRTWPVDRRVGSPRNNGAELIKSIEIAI